VAEADVLGSSRARAALGRRIRTSGTDVPGRAAPTGCI
jgi:hypothetical protein